jgi:hypothetical protein
VRGAEHVAQATTLRISPFPKDIYTEYQVQLRLGLIGMKRLGDIGHTVQVDNLYAMTFSAQGRGGMVSEEPRAAILRLPFQYEDLQNSSLLPTPPTGAATSANSEEINLDGFV